MRRGLLFVYPHPRADLNIFSALMLSERVEEDAEHRTPLVEKTSLLSSEALATYTTSDSALRCFVYEKRCAHAEPYENKQKYPEFPSRRRLLEFLAAG